MLKNIKFIWKFPSYFFIFLTIFTFVKFIFIFFFRAAYEPRILFELTPLHVLSGINNLQLLFMSLIIISLDMYLHINGTKKNLTYSFLVTATICSGIILGISSREPAISDIYHYLIFGCVLIVILIDHRYILSMPGSKEVFVEEGIEHTKLVDKTIKRTNKLNKGIIARFLGISPKKFLNKLYNLLPLRGLIKSRHPNKIKPIQNKTSTTPKSQLKEIPKREEKFFQPISKELIDLDKKRLSKAEIKISEIEEKTDKLLVLEKEIKSTRKYLDDTERKIARHILSNFKREKSTPVNNVYKISTTSKRNNNEKYKDDFKKSFEEIKDYAAVIQDGIFKQVKKSMAELIGYDVNEIVDKKMIEFISSDSLYEIGKYYLSKLKGEETSGYFVKLLTKNKEKIVAEVKISLIVYEGKKAELAIFKINKK